LLDLLSELTWTTFPVFGVPTAVIFVALYSRDPERRRTAVMILEMIFRRRGGPDERGPS
jgi:hypothetical protein